MTPIKAHAYRCPMSRCVFLKLILNDNVFDITLPESFTSFRDYTGEIDTLELFKFIRGNMDLRTINQFKQIEEDKE